MLSFQQRHALEHAANDPRLRVIATGKGDGRDRATLRSLKQRGLLDFIGTKVIAHAHEQVYRITESGMQALEEDRLLDAKRWQQKLNKRAKRKLSTVNDGGNRSRFFIDGDEFGSVEGWSAIVIPPGDDGDKWLAGLSRYSEVPLENGRFEFKDTASPRKFLEYVATLLADEELEWYANRSFKIGGRPRPDGSSA